MLQKNISPFHSENIKYPTPWLKKRKKSVSMVVKWSALATANLRDRARSSVRAAGGAHLTQLLILPPGKHKSKQQLGLGGNWQTVATSKASRNWLNFDQVSRRSRTWRSWSLCWYAGAGSNCFHFPCTWSEDFFLAAFIEQDGWTLVHDG